MITVFTAWFTGCRWSHGFLKVCRDFTVLLFFPHKHKNRQFVNTYLEKYMFHVENTVHTLRLKKKYFVSKLARIFQTDAACVFLFFILFFFFTSIGLCLHAHPKPKMTEKFQLPYFQKSNGILHVFWAPTCFYSSKTANFLSFFVVKMKKKNNFKKKKWKSEFCQIKCAQKIKCGRQLWDTEFFFF